MKTNILIKNNQKIIQVSNLLRYVIRESIKETLQYEKICNNVEVSVTYVDNEQIHILNKNFRGVDRPTDVLSFPLFDDYTKNETIYLGDIVISLEKAKEQSIEYDHSFLHEMSFLTIHSMLHLLGYDHETCKEDEDVMFSKQRDIINNLGI